MVIIGSSESHQIKALRTAACGCENIECGCVKDLISFIACCIAETEIKSYLLG